MTFHFMWCTLLSEGCLVFITIHFTAVTFLWWINSVCHGMNNILTTFMYLHFGCLQLCVYLLLLFYCANVSNESRQKVAVSVAWYDEPCQGMLQLKLCKEEQKSCHWLCYAWWLEDGKKWKWELVFCQSFKWRAKKNWWFKKHEHEGESEAFCFCGLHNKKRNVQQ